MAGGVSLSMSSPPAFHFKDPDMATFLSGGTRELIADASINALDEARSAGIPDWEAREEFVRAAGVAFDVSAEPPANLLAADRPEFFG